MNLAVEAVGRVPCKCVAQPGRALLSGRAAGSAIYCSSGFGLEPQQQLSDLRRIRPLADAGWNGPPDDERPKTRTVWKLRRSVSRSIVKRITAKVEWHGNLAGQRRPSEEGNLRFFCRVVFAGIA